MDLGRITTDPGVLDGLPVIRGLPISVSAVVALVAAGKDADEIIAELPGLTHEDIREALQYAARVVADPDAPPPLAEPAAKIPPMPPLLPQGWYRDPYGVHQDRYFSAGTPTSLVRDGDREGNDPPPAQPLPDAPLASAEDAGEEAVDGSDLRRADSAETLGAGQSDPVVTSIFDRLSVDNL